MTQKVKSSMQSQDIKCICTGKYKIYGGIKHNSTFTEIMIFSIIIPQKWLSGNIYMKNSGLSYRYRLQEQPPFSCFRGLFSDFQHAVINTAFINNFYK